MGHFGTIGRRLAGGVGPDAFLGRGSSLKKQNTYSNGGGDNSKDVSSDVLLFDITKETYKGEIARLVGTPYLSPATPSEATKMPIEVTGFIYGPKRRTIVSLAVSYKKECCWVFFVVDSGSPLTYLSVGVSPSFINNASSSN